MCHTSDDFHRWIKGQRLLIREVMIKEQLLLSVPEEVAVWLKERTQKIWEVGR